MWKHSIKETNAIVFSSTSIMRSLHNNIVRRNKHVQNTPKTIYTVVEQMR